MRMIFVHYVLPDRGSAQDMYNYVRAARALGHEIVLYGQPKEESPFEYTLDIEDGDAAVFMFEWTTQFQYGDRLDWVRLASKIPSARRIVVDCDGKYNDAISVLGDFNHKDEDSSRRWIEVCDSISDRVFQPTYRPRRSNVRPFFIHAYDPRWEVPLDFSAKNFSMVYVGNNWFRWRSLKKVLDAIAVSRQQFGRISIVGNGWDGPAPWVNDTLPEDAYFTDPDYLTRLGVEVSPPVEFHEVVETMGLGVFSPVIYRPLFDYLRLVTCRSFETVAANTVPLFAQDAEFVEEIYGSSAGELVLGEETTVKMLDVVQRPDYYASVVTEVRRYLRKTYSYEARIRELVAMFE